ncbi:MAG: hypothetical protein ACI8WB_001591 [Phenylobacterium sp.]|jgi:hypothetical protein
MKIVKVGDNQKAACNDCQSFQQVTFKLRDVPFSDGSGMVKHVLVGVCDCCGGVVLLPHQSVPAVQRQLATQRKALESRVPAHMIDILNLASVELSGGTEFVSNLMKFYIHLLSNDAIASKALTHYLDSHLAQGKSQKRISVKGRQIMAQIDQLKAMTDIQSTTDLIKGIVLKIHDDVLVNKDQATIKQLQGIVAATV